MMGISCQTVIYSPRDTSKKYKHVVRVGVCVYVSHLKIVAKIKTNKQKKSAALISPSLVQCAISICVGPVTSPKPK